MIGIHLPEHDGILNWKNFLLSHFSRELFSERAYSSLQGQKECSNIRFYFTVKIRNYGNSFYGLINKQIQLSHLLQLLK